MHDTRLKAASDLGENIHEMQVKDVMQAAAHAVLHTSSTIEAVWTLKRLEFSEAPVIDAKSGQLCAVVQLDDLVLLLLKLAVRHPMIGSIALRSD